MIGALMRCLIRRRNGPGINKRRYVPAHNPIDQPAIATVVMKQDNFGPARVFLVTGAKD